MPTEPSSRVAWPALPLAEWRDTYRSLNLYMQIIGKIKLTLTPKMNQWWNVPLYVTARGLTTSPIPYRDRSFEIDFDFIEHELVVKDTDGHVRAMALVPRSVKDFHHELFAVLEALDIHARIWPVPVEIPETTPFFQDTKHDVYVAEHAHRFWQVLRRVAPVFDEFRAGFRGKSSPVHFFWGTFDLAVSRFSGRRAPLREANRIERDAYDEEVFSIGFWPGEAWAEDASHALDAVFYAYEVPGPPGFAEQRVRPSEAFYTDRFKEFVLPYEAVRNAAEPARAILQFAESTYDASSTLARWPRAALAYP